MQIVDGHGRRLPGSIGANSIDERELIPAALTYGFGLIPWSPLAGGFLTDELKALELTTTREDRTRIDAISPPGGVIAPLYEAQLHFREQPLRAECCWSNDDSPKLTDSWLERSRTHRPEIC